jgi:hypothetical protein
MKLLHKWLTIAAVAAVGGWGSSASGQDCGPGGCGFGHHGAGYNDGNCGPRPAWPCPDAAPSTDCIGAVGPHGRRYLGPARTASLAVRDNYSPEPFYTYGSAGLDATRMDYWNRQQAMQYSWHGGYNYWRYGAPTALVVPPTAAFQAEYNWGVAQTRMLPIYPQFSQNAAVVGAPGYTVPGQFQNTPYWPSSTSQFGIYPVRGPW